MTLPDSNVQYTMLECPFQHTSWEHTLNSFFERSRSSAPAIIDGKFTQSTSLIDPLKQSADKFPWINGAVLLPEAEGGIFSSLKSATLEGFRARLWMKTLT